MWLWALATLVAFYIKGLCGFANTLVFTSILSMGTTNINISPIELAIGYPGNLIMTWKYRSHLKRKIYLPLIALVLCGSVPGALLLKNVDAKYVTIICGCVIILVGIEMLLREFQILRTKESRIVLGIIGLMSGIFCGLFGIGALLAAYVGRVTENSEDFKANISMVFIVENTFRVVLYAVLGIFTISGLQRALILIPVVLVGLFAGIMSSKILNEKVVKRIVILLLIASGVMITVKAF
ncbi:MAG: sulfite exporter TauE/SafE family protein [Agathobacter sp.]|uniref:sulfite exporter TauE/SafE family protein n=1 Tax=Agathobacter sp. TaxID=2021311 RepID=UPI00258D031A|nr:sulfite exporter TauE/SafE family protein [Agathobacter sp.]MCR5677925.1 sulfite exporter TauE/SafE family protein [Agathobacter sp.]